LELPNSLLTIFFGLPGNFFPVRKNTLTKKFFLDIIVEENNSGSEM